MPSGSSLYLDETVYDHATGGTIWVQPANLRLQLCTTAPTKTSPGTPLSGGSWSPPVIPFGTFDSGTDGGELNVTINASNVPAAHVVGATIIDPAGNVYWWTDEVDITFAGGENPQWAAGQIRKLFL